MIIFEDSGSQGSIEVPWISDYILENPEVPREYCSRIERIVLTEKGFLVIASDYKSFAFPNSSTWKMLIEAFDTWSDLAQVHEVPGMFLFCQKALKLGLDDNINGVTVTLEKGKVAELSWGKEQPSSNSENPLLSKSRRI